VVLRGTVGSLAVRRGLERGAAAAGRNPDKWFGNIDKHYLACGLLHQQERGHLRALGESRPDGG